MKKIMKQYLQLSLTALLLFSLSAMKGQKVSPLEEAWIKLAKPFQSTYLSLTFSERRSELEPNYAPWQVTPYKIKGTVWCNAENFMKHDSIVFGRRTYQSKTQYNSSTLLWQNYNSQLLSPVPKIMFDSYLLQTARYTPVMLLDYFKKKNIAPSINGNSYYTLYTATIDKKVVSLFIKNSDNMLYQASMLESDEMYGDVLTSISYNDYMLLNNIMYPSKISIGKYNSKVMDEVLVSRVESVPSASPLLNKPSNYSYTTEVIVKPALSVEKHSDNIHFITLKHTDHKVMVVEFKDFLVVAEAPLNSANGELIINEAKKIAPGKPIRYFVFGTHHPNSIGGIRAFVSEGAKIIVPQPTSAYAKYLAVAPHKLNPDILERQPKAIMIDTMKSDMKLISDGKFDMKIYLIGEKSKYTGDYLLYYFPSEKLVFEDEMILMHTRAKSSKARQRQVALYNYIKEKKLDVQTIVQSAYATSKDFKSVITFEELEKSVTGK